MASYIPTASQTAGPFFRGALHRPDWEDLTTHLEGKRIEISGRVLDGDGAGVFDAMLEIWQADGQGRYADGTIRGFGRVCTNESGAFTIVTVVPGPVEGQAPHLNVSVFARGLLKRLVTRIYFADRSSENAGDAVLGLAPEARRATMLAKPSEKGRYLYDVRLQGPDETVFFESPTG
ncbi:MAG: protocatechuate 3,4-dioxygenase subunit alpha [Vulcanimicrobiaceae bacterium]